MLAGLLCLLVLVGALCVLRARFPAHAEGQGPGQERGADGSAERVAVRRWELPLCLLGLLAAAAPILSLAPMVHGPPGWFPGDAASHARVASELARTGLPGGWVDAYVGGFPIGHHYPPLGWLLLASGIRAGLSPALATHLLGWGAVLAAPVATFWALTRNGLRPRHALVGGVVVCLVSPYNAFIGGSEAFFAMGLLSQVVALPLCIWFAGALVAAARPGEISLAAVLAMAAHPQVTVASMVVMGVGALAAGRRALLRRGLRAALVGGVAGVALYGQGLLTLRIPLGWPPGMGWQHLGFPPSRLQRWLVEGDLLDLGRAPLLTSLATAACLTLLLLFRSPAARGLLAALAAALTIGVSGRLLLALGGLGQLLLSFLQPLRALSLVPVLAAAAIAVALREASRQGSRVCAQLERPRLRRWLAGGLPVAALALAALALPSRLRWAARLWPLLAREPTACHLDPSAPLAGYDPELIRRWLGELRGGSLWYGPEPELMRCVISDGLDLSSAVPIYNGKAVGSHVGMLAHAAVQLEPRAPGSARQAEALGIGYALVRQREPASSGWTLRRRRGAVELWEQPAARVGAGCVRDAWRGGHRALNGELHRALSTASGWVRLLDPHRYTALEYAEGQAEGTAEGGVEKSPVPGDACDADAARVRVLSDESGRLRASISSPSPVDVVFRLTAFPTFRVWVDEQPTEPVRLVAPGFPSVRVPAGDHELRARVTTLPSYRWWLLAGAVACALLTWLRPRELWRLVRLLRGKLRDRAPA